MRTLAILLFFDVQILVVKESFMCPTEDNHGPFFYAWYEDVAWMDVYQLYSHTDKLQSLFVWKTHVHFASLLPELTLRSNYNTPALVVISHQISSVNHRDRFKKIRRTNCKILTVKFDGIWQPERLYGWISQNRFQKYYFFTDFKYARLEVTVEVLFRR